VTIVLALLLRQVRALARIFRDREGTKVAVIGLFALLFLLVMAGEYLMVRQGLAEVRAIGGASAALTLYILEGFLILVLVVSLISFVGNGLWTFFRAADTAFLLATPLPLGHLFWLRAVETFFLSSWAFVILGVPAFMALGAAYGQGAVFHLRALVVLILFMALAGGMGAVLSMVAGAALRRYRAGIGMVLATVTLAGTFAFLVGLQIVPSVADFYVIFEPAILNGKPASLKFVESRFGLWPTHPLAVLLYRGVSAATMGSPALAGAAWFLPLLALLAAGVLGRALFTATLPIIAEGAGASRRARTRTAGGRPAFPRLLPGPIGALVERDLTLLARSPEELGRAAFVTFLLILYTAVLFLAPLRQALEKPEVAARLFFLDLLALGYFLTAFGIRFVFPSLSLEGRAAWVVLTSPVPVARLLLAKLLASSALLLLVVGPIAGAGVTRFVSQPALLGLFALLLALMTVTTTSVSLAFGVLWPNFKEPNADRLATNAGGLGTILLCLAYVAGVAWLGRGAVLAFAQGESLAAYAASALALSAPIIAGVTVAAHRRLNRLEIL